MAVFFSEGDSFEEFLTRALGASRSNRGINLFSLLNPRAQELVRAAGAKASHSGHATIENAHLLAALIEDTGVDRILSTLKVDKKALANAAEALISAEPSSEATDVPQVGSSAQQTLFRAAQISRQFGSPRVEPEHILFSLISQPETDAGIALITSGVTPDALRSGRPVAPAGRRPRPDSKTPTLDQYGIDMTELAHEGKLDPVIGRQEEIQQTIEILLRRSKNNPVLIGEPGTGKTAVAEGIAQAIAAGDVPDLLKNRRVVSLDLPSMVAGAKFRGDFEERITGVINEVVENKEEIILFLDEMHTVLGAGGGGEGGMDAANILKPRLAKGDLHLIGATTLKEYRRIEKDAAFERRFQPVTIKEPSLTDAVLILQGIKDNYEKHHNVRYADEAIAASVDLSNRYITDRFLPDKAIDLIDQAGARKRILSGVTDTEEDLRSQLAAVEEQKQLAVDEERYEEANRFKLEAEVLEERMASLAKKQSEQLLLITENDIAEIIARSTGIPAARLTEDDRSRLAKLESELHESVVGQEEAVSAVAKSIRRSRSGLGDASRPIGSFLFLGPTGVGKTELSKSLAKDLFGSEKALIRFDMSEYAEKHTASRLVGAPPGYVGYDEAGQLTEKVRRNPYSVVLLDEIEKAHPDIFNLLLQVLDDGRLTDGQGRTVDFRNTVLIMTSNLGSEFLASKSGSIGFTTAAAGTFGSDDEVRQRVMAKLREAMRPEFLNRIDEIVLFKKLELTELREITKLLLRDSEVRLAAQGIKMSVPEEAVTWIAEHGYDAQYGARPLRRLIQREVDDKAADLIILGAVESGGKIELSVEDGRLYVSVAAEAAEPALTLDKA